MPQGGLEISCKLTFHTNKKSKADKTAKLIKNTLRKNITNTETAVDVNFSSCPTSASKSQHSSVTSVSFASINLDDDMEQPAKKQKLGSKDVEDIIMGTELSDRHISMAQSLLKSQFPQLNGLRSSLLQGKQLQSTDDTAIAFDQNAANKRFNQESIRTHLAACLQQNKITPFP